MIGSRTNLSVFNAERVVHLRTKMTGSIKSGAEFQSLYGRNPEHQRRDPIFLPVKDVEGYTVVHPELLKNPETKQFIIDIGVKQPSLKDQIYTIILPQYKDGGSPDSKAHFKLFFKYYRKCSTDEVDEFIDLIKDYPILQFHEDGKVNRIKADQLYLPSCELRQYFESKPTTYFVDFDDYLELVGREQEKYLLSF